MFALALTIGMSASCTPWTGDNIALLCGDSWEAAFHTSRLSGDITLDALDGPGINLHYVTLSTLEGEHPFLLGKYTPKTGQKGAIQTYAPDNTVALGTCVLRLHFQVEGQRQSVLCVLQPHPQAAAGAVNTLLGPRRMLGLNNAHRGRLRPITTEWPHNQVYFEC